jgi:hypothetical protein
MKVAGRVTLRGGAFTYHCQARAAVDVTPMARFRQAVRAPVQQQRLIASSTLVEHDTTQ